MPLFVLGLNHKTAPLALRETVGFADNELPEALQDAHKLAEEVSLVSTCNRTELYAIADDPQPLLQWWASAKHIQADALTSHGYQLQARDCVQHMMQVAAGIDSMVLGEPQILGQLKHSYAVARQQGCCGPVLSRLHEHAFSLAKLVRSQTGIGANPVSVAFAAIALARRIFTDFSQLKVLLIGAGEMTRLAAQHLHSAGSGQMIFANRTMQRAQALASQHHGVAIALADLPDHLGSADLILSCTASSGYTVTLAQMRAALKNQRHRPVLMLDLAVPRDLDPALDQLEDIYLYTVDDLQNVVDENLRSRQAAAQDAQQMIAERADDYMHWLRTRVAAAAITHMRQQAGQQAEQVGARARHLLQQGKPADEVISFMQRAMLNKLLHPPSVALRNASPEMRKQLLQALNELFGLDPENPT